MSKKAYQQYQRVTLATADPTKIIVLLYEGAIRYLNQGAEHFSAGRNTEGGERLKRALDIVHYLYNSLDFENGGEISENLARLYDFVRDTISGANISADVDAIREAIDVLRPLLEGWQGIAAQANPLPESPPVEPPADAPGISMMG